eukprot:4909252-Prymnesium_polylepis.1
MGARVHSVQLRLLVLASQPHTQHRHHPPCCCCLCAPSSGAIDASGGAAALGGFGTRAHMPYRLSDVTRNDFHSSTKSEKEAALYMDG